MKKLDKITIKKIKFIDKTINNQILFFTGNSVANATAAL